MGKTAQIKGDLDDIEAILEIISILKDVSTNKFFQFAQQKEDFSKFLAIFLVFFGMLENVQSNCPLVRNENPGTDIVVITSESSFMAQLNGKVCNAAMREAEKYPGSRIVCVGYRGADKLKSLGATMERVYTDIDKVGRYQIALDVRDYLIDRMMGGECGRAICIYVWAKSFNVLKPRVVRLLPAEELLNVGEEDAGGEQAGPAAEQPKPQKKNFIAESSIDGIMKVLADIWVSSRLFEMISDSLLAEAASQAQQLESAIEGMSKDKKGLILGLKKASRGDLNKAMREVFTSSQVCKRKR